MIYVMRTVAAAAAIQAPVSINLTDAQSSPQRPTLCLGVCNSLASVFSNSPRAFEGSNSKASLTFYRRFVDFQTWRQLQQHVIGRNCNANRYRLAESSTCSAE